MAKQKVTIHNQISPNYKQVHVDGAFGGLTTRGLINLSFYAERLPIPKSSDFEISEQGTVGTLLTNSEDSKNGIIREYDFGVYMDINAAKSLIEFLSQKVSDLENALKLPNESSSAKKK